MSRANKWEPPKEILEEIKRLYLEEELGPQEIRWRFRVSTGAIQNKLKEMIEILRLSNGKAVCIEGKELTRDEAHEIIIKLTDTWGTNFEKQELKDAALGLKHGG